MVQQPPLPTHATCLLFVGASRRPSFVVERCKVPFKELGPSEALVRVRLAGLCASDLRRFVSEDGECALIPGHEAVGDVIASRRPDVDVGARVVFSASNWCMACDWCRQGAHVACENVTKYGQHPLAALSSSDGVLGGTLSSHVLLRSGTAVCTVPATVSDGHALLATCPLATAVAGVLRLTQCHRPPLDRLGWKDAGSGTESEGSSGGRPCGGPTALVQGCGLVGILACAVLAECGFKVFCEDNNISRLRLASKFHAQPVFKDAGPLTPLPALPERLDAVVIAFGSRLNSNRNRLGLGGQQTSSTPLLQGHAGLLLRPGGTLLLLGQPSSSPPGRGPDSAVLEAGAVLGKGLCVVGTSEYEPDNLKDAVQFLEATKGKFPYDELLSPVYGMVDFQSALASALDRKFLRVLVRPC